MAGKAKFDQETAFKSIIGADRELKVGSRETPIAKGRNKDRVQRSYFLDRDIDKALRRMAIDEEKNLMLWNCLIPIRISAFIWRISQMPSVC